MAINFIKITFLHNFLTFSTRTSICQKKRQLSKHVYPLRAWGMIQNFFFFSKSPLKTREFLLSNVVCKMNTILLKKFYVTKFWTKELLRILWLSYHYFLKDFKHTCFYTLKVHAFGCFDGPEVLEIFCIVCNPNMKMNVLKRQMSTW